MKARGLENQITVLCQDYRQLEGTFDKLVSIEMIEAVGHEFYESYFRCVSKLLKPTGKAVIQAITIPDQRYDFARQSVDYIKRYISPGAVYHPCESLVKISLNIQICRLPSYGTLP